MLSDTFSVFSCRLGTRDGTCRDLRIGLSSGVLMIRNPFRFVWRRSVVYADMAVMT